MTRPDLSGIVEATPAPELPHLIGDLEAAKAAAWARLTASMTETPPDGPNPVARNLDVAEAAERLGISRGWLYRNAARLPFAVRIGRRVLFDANGLERWNRGRTMR